MFMLIRNTRTLFMMCLTNNLEGAAARFDAQGDGLDTTETQALLESREAREIVETTEVDTLEAAVTLAGTIDFTDGLSPLEQRTIQYLATKIQKLNNGPVQDGSIDGNIGRGSRADIQAASGINIGSNADITQTVLVALITNARTLITTKRAELALAAAEREDTLEQARATVSSFNIDADKNDRTKVEALQGALIALGYTLRGRNNGVDGAWGGSTESAYNEELTKIGEAHTVAEREAAERAISEAQQRVVSAREMLALMQAQIPSDREMEESELIASIDAVNQRIGTLIRENNASSIDEIESEEIKGIINQLLDMKTRSEASLERVRNGGSQLDGYQTEVESSEAAVVAAQSHLDTLHLERSIESDVYSRLDIEGDVTAEAVKNALKNDPEGRQLLCQLQADLKLLKDSDGNTLYTGAIDGHLGIDRAFGPGTARAVTKALELHGNLLAIRRAARIEEVRLEAERNEGIGRTNTGIDLVARTEGYEAGALEAFLAEYKVTDNMPESIQNGTPEEQQTWIIDQAIAMADRENADRTRLTFIDGLSQHGNDRLRDVMSDLRRNFETTAGRAELTTAMIGGVDLSSQDFGNTRGFITLGNTNINARLLDSAYIATGSDVTRDVDGTQQRGTMEVPIWNTDGTLNPKFEELDFANATYINGAIVMTMKNGCQGNIVIIPVQREKYVPPVVVRQSQPIQPRPETRQPEPEGPRLILKSRWCDDRTHTYWEQWGYADVAGGTSRDTGEPCGGGENPGGNDTDGSEPGRADPVGQPSTDTPF